MNGNGNGGHNNYGSYDNYDNDADNVANDLDWFILACGTLYELKSLIYFNLR